MNTLTIENTLEERIEALEAAFQAAQVAAAGQSTQTSASRREDKMCMVVFSGDLDKILAALTIATGAAAIGTEVCMFFTFWATPFLKSGQRTGAAGGKRSATDKMFGRMLPPGEKGLRLSRMHMGGAGKAMIKKRMRDKNIAGCEELLQMAKESGVRIKVCDMSMDLMGIRKEDLIDYPGLEQCGVATFMEHSLNACATLFI
jgi:peroxiredoxin family protein